MLFVLFFFTLIFWTLEDGVVSSSNYDTNSAVALQFLLQVSMFRTLQFHSVTAEIAKSCSEQLVLGLVGNSSSS